MTRTDKAFELLRDASYMLRTIKDARQLPPFAQAQQQYAALGDRIQEFLDRKDDSQ